MKSVRSVFCSILLSLFNSEHFRLVGKVSRASPSSPANPRQSKCNIWYQSQVAPDRVTMADGTRVNELRKEVDTEGLCCKNKEKHRRAASDDDLHGHESASSSSRCTPTH